MDNTAIIDSSLAALAVIVAVLFSAYMYRNSVVSVKRYTLILVSFAGFWSLFNWVAHLVAVSIVNINKMAAGNFTYSYHFYSLMFMGIVFSALSGMVIYYITQLNNGKIATGRQLRLVCYSIIFLSLPIAPINPIGLLPVICSVIILVTMFATRKQWCTLKQEPTAEAHQLVKA